MDLKGTVYENVEYINLTVYSSVTGLCEQVMDLRIWQETT
jgi:hypothetical protein